MYEQILPLQPIGKVLDRITAGHRQGPNLLCNLWFGFHPILSLGQLGHRYGVEVALEVTVMSAVHMVVILWFLPWL